MTIMMWLGLPTMTMMDPACADDDDDGLRLPMMTMMGPACPQ